MVDYLVRLAVGNGITGSSALTSNAEGTIAKSKVNARVDAHLPLT